jgi:hypothetical protein
LAGISVPIWHWRRYNQDIENIKKKYDLAKTEIHVAWILRPYLEQRRIPDFDNLDYNQRRYQVNSQRTAELLELQKDKNPKHYKQTRKNYKLTEPYIHLTYNDRKNLVKELATCVANWGSARLFAECLDKIHFDPVRAAGVTIDEQCFEQLVSRFEQYLQIISRSTTQAYGILIHDNNPTVAQKHTNLMKKFHQRGTLWTQVENIIETPLFVDSQLTSMVQIADLCSYALRRYLENGEEELFDLVFQRADRKENRVVGVRHFTNSSCECKICSSR